MVKMYNNSYMLTFFDPVSEKTDFASFNKKENAHAYLENNFYEKGYHCRAFLVKLRGDRFRFHSLKLENTLMWQKCRKTEYNLVRQFNI